jgi:hypothetical protein
VRLEAARAEEDLHAFGAQGFDAAAERGAAGQAVLTNGRTTIGMPRPVASASTPRAWVSLMSGVHLLMVMQVAGATRMASGTRDLGAPGLAYWLRTRLPVWPAMAAASKKSSAAGVAVTWTVQLRSWASLMQVLIAPPGRRHRRSS